MAEKYKVHQPFTSALRKIFKKIDPTITTQKEEPKKITVQRPQEQPFTPDPSNYTPLPPPPPPRPPPERGRFAPKPRPPPPTESSLPQEESFTPLPEADVINQSTLPPNQSRLSSGVAVGGGGGTIKKPQEELAEDFQSITVGGKQYAQSSSGLVFNPFTGAQVGVVRQAPTFRQRRREFVKDRNPISANIEFGLGAIREKLSKFERKTTGVEAFTGGETGEQFQKVVDTGIYFVPVVGEVRAIAESGATFTKGGRKEVKLKSEILSEKINNYNPELQLNNQLVEAGVFTASVGLGLTGTKLLKGRVGKATTKVDTVFLANQTPAKLENDILKFDSEFVASSKEKNLFGQKGEYVTAGKSRIEINEKALKKTIDLQEKQFNANADELFEFKTAATGVTKEVKKVQKFPKRSIENEIKRQVALEIPTGDLIVRNEGAIFKSASVGRLKRKTQTIFTEQKLSKDVKAAFEKDIEGIEFAGFGKSAVSDNIRGTKKAKIDFYDPDKFLYKGKAGVLDDSKILSESEIFRIRDKRGRAKINKKDRIFNQGISNINDFENKVQAFSTGKKITSRQKKVLRNPDFDKQLLKDIEQKIIASDIESSIKKKINKNLTDTKVYNASTVLSNKINQFTGTTVKPQVALKTPQPFQSIVNEKSLQTQIDKSATDFEKRFKEATGTTSGTKEGNRYVDRTGFREVGRQKPKTAIAEAQVIKQMNAVEMKIPKVPFTPKVPKRFITPFFVPPVFRRKPEPQRRRYPTKKKSRKPRRTLFYTAGFTERTLGLRERLTPKQFERKIRRGFSGIELRKIPEILA